MTPNTPDLGEKHMALSPPDQEMRFRCLRLAVERQTGAPIADAHKFHDFVTGKSDQTPRQMIDAALDQADVK